MFCGDLDQQILATPMQSCRYDMQHLDERDRVRLSVRKYMYIVRWVRMGRHYFSVYGLHDDWSSGHLTLIALEPLLQKYHAASSRFYREDCRMRPEVDANVAR